MNSSKLVILIFLVATLAICLNRHEVTIAKRTGFILGCSKVFHKLYEALDLKKIDEVSVLKECTRLEEEK